MYKTQNRKRVLGIAGFMLVPALMCIAQQAPPVMSPGARANRWVHPYPDSVVVSAGCRVTESFSSVTLERKDYVQCPGFKKPQLFYRHFRGIGMLISANHRFMLVNDYFATKSSRVVLVDLTAHQNKNISAVPMRAYKREVSPDPGVIVQPEGCRFSRDGDFVLMKIGPIYYSVPSRAEAKRLESEAQTRWYVVSTDTGSIVHQYHGTEPPISWTE